MESFAERYDAVMVPVIFRPWAQELMRRLPPWDGARILDLACGTGAVTREVATSGAAPGRLTGADHSAGMLEAARAAAERQGIEAEWVQADAAALPFGDDAFDLAYCQQALQFFPDRIAALHELRRVLVAEGAAVFCVSTGLSENPLLAAQAEALDRFVGHAAGDAVRAIGSLTDPNVLRSEFGHAGFGDVTVEKVTLTLHHPDGRAYAAGAMGGMHTGDKLARLSDADRAACFDTFMELLGDCVEGTAIRFPHTSHVVVARA